MKKKIVLMVVVVFLLAGCAHGPKVTRVTSGNFEELAHDHRQVFYALPRSLVQVELPVKTRTLRCGLLHWLNVTPGDHESFPTAFPGDCPKTFGNGEVSVGSLTFNNGALSAGPECKPANSVDSSHVCSLSFQRRTLTGGRRLLTCQSPVPELNTDVVLAGTPSSSVLAVPDPEQIFAISLTPRAFEKLELDIEIAANGAPTRLSSTSSSALTEFAQAYVGAWVGALGTKDFEVSPQQLGELSSLDDEGENRAIIAAIDQMIERILGLETRRSNLINAGGSNSEALATLVAEQRRLRAIIEGGVSEKEQRLRLVFDPPGSSADVFEPAGFGPCGTAGRTQQVEPTLLLTNDRFSEAWVDRQKPSKPQDQTNAGFRYRVPQQVISPSVELRYACPTPHSEDSEGSECSWPIEVARSLTINQMGTVRSLPRRIGWGAGSVDSALDPQTGALKLIGSEGAGSLQQPFIAATTEAEKDHELAGLQREKTELELRISICKNRRELGLPLPSECPDPD